MGGVDDFEFPQDTDGTQVRLEGQDAVFVILQIILRQCFLAVDEDRNLGGALL